LADSNPIASAISGNSNYIDATTSPVWGSRSVNLFSFQYPLSHYFRTTIIFRRKIEELRFFVLHVLEKVFGNIRIIQLIRMQRRPVFPLVHASSSAVISATAPLLPLSGRDGLRFYRIDDRGNDAVVRGTVLQNRPIRKPIGWRLVRNMYTNIGQGSR
jgi:hypothetical protein